MRKILVAFVALTIPFAVAQTAPSLDVLDELASRLLSASST